MPIKLLSLFSGIGAFEKALKNIGAEYELLGFSEVDKNAIKAYTAIHGVSPDKNLGDVAKINGYRFTDQVDLLTYGFPCQDISRAGLRAGFVNSAGEITRSGLFFEAARLIKECRPKVAIFENVEALNYDKELLDTILSTIDDLGYTTYTQVLDARDFNIPQSRRRIFGISIRQDIQLPEPIPLEKTSFDMLEETIDDSLILTPKQEERNKIVREGNKIGRLNKFGLVWFENGTGINIRCRNWNSWSKLVYPTLDTEGQFGISLVDNCGNPYLKYLSPLEYWRIQGFMDDDYQKAAATRIPLGGLIKLAGNSICVPVLEAVFKQLIKFELLNYE